MAIIAVAGDTATTTSVALASAWPADTDVLLVEADGSGGDLAAWFDIPAEPSLSTVVTRAVDGSWSAIEQLTRSSTSGLRSIPAPAGVAEATQAVRESARSLVPTLAALRSPFAIADTGRSLDPGHPFVEAAALVVAVHRQSTQTARAAGVRLERFAERLEALSAASPAVVAAVVGATPFAISEIESFLAEQVGPMPTVGLPVDALAAAVLAGRAGVSERRLAKLPLLRSARDLAVVCDRGIADATPSQWRTAR